MCVSVVDFLDLHHGAVYIVHNRISIIEGDRESDRGNAASILVPMIAVEVLASTMYGVFQWSLESSSV